MSGIKVFFGYSKSMLPKQRYTFIIWLISIVFTATYALFYIFFTDSVFVLSSLVFYIINYSVILFLLKVRKYFISKILIIFTLIVQVTVLVYFVFPLDTHINYFYLLTTPISFLIFDVKQKKDRYLIFLFSLAALILMVMSEWVDYSSTYIVLSKLAVKHFSMLSTIAIISSVYFVYYSYARNLGKLHKKLNTLANTDSLTNTLNRRVLFKSGNECFNECSELNKSFSFILMDLDNFKKINDVYGHPVGDSVLVQLAGLIKSNIRSCDVFARYGGEEFAIICKSSTMNDCIKKAYILKNLIENNNFMISSEKTINITISMGVVSFSNNNYNSFDTMVQHADRALYIAKAEGRNRIVKLESEEI